MQNGHCVTLAMSVLVTCFPHPLASFFSVFGSLFFTHFSPIFYLWEVAWLLQSLPSLCKLPPPRTVTEALPGGWHFGLPRKWIRCHMKSPFSGHAEECVSKLKEQLSSKFEVLQVQSCVLSDWMCPMLTLLCMQDWEGTLWVGSTILWACCSSQKLHMLKSFLDPATKGWFSL